MGLTVALLVYLNQPCVTPTSPRTANVSAADSPNTAVRKDRTAAPKERRFDFYTLLPELEVVVPDRQSPQAATASRDGPAHQTATVSGSYVLQAGSFQRAAEAESLKANLALLGVEADIQKVTVDNNTWHRVRIGPYADLAELDEVRTRLTRNRIDTVILRERQQ